MKITDDYGPAVDSVLTKINVNFSYTIKVRVQEVLSQTVYASVFGPLQAQVYEDAGC